MKPMYFKLCHNPENKTLAIPRAALQLSGLADAEELILLTGGDKGFYDFSAAEMLFGKNSIFLLHVMTFGFHVIPPPDTKDD